MRLGFCVRQLAVNLAQNRARYRCSCKLQNRSSHYFLDASKSRRLCRAVAWMKCNGIQESRIPLPLHPGYTIVRPAKPTRHSQQASRAMQLSQRPLLPTRLPPHLLQHFIDDTTVDELVQIRQRLSLRPAEFRCGSGFKKIFDQITSGKRYRLIFYESPEKQPIPITPPECRKLCAVHEVQRLKRSTAPSTPSLRARGRGSTRQRAGARRRHRAISQTC